MVIDKIKRRLGNEQGFTLIELLIVLIILGILVAIAVPSYISFRQKAQVAAAQANVRSAIPAAESYYQDAAGGNNSYNLITGAKLRLQAPGVSANVTAGYNAAKDGYCIQDVEGAAAVLTWSYSGGTGGTATITNAACSVVTYTMG